MQAYRTRAVEVNAQNTGVYGIKRPCSFVQNLHDFDTTKRFPPDIMHDLLEGVLPLTTRLVLAHFVQVRQLEEVNKVLVELDLAHAGNKPNKLNATSLSSHITGTAAQTLELFLLLPRLLGHFVGLHTQNNVWIAYLYLREICDVVLAPVVDADMLTLLDDLACRYLSPHAEVFGRNSIIPKNHYTVHYAYHLSLFGPLRHMCCMRFEAKYRYFQKCTCSI